MLKDIPGQDYIAQTRSAIARGPNRIDRRTLIALSSRRVWQRTLCVDVQRNRHPGDELRAKIQLDRRIGKRNPGARRARRFLNPFAAVNILLGRRHTDTEVLPIGNLLLAGRRIQHARTYIRLSCAKYPKRWSQRLEQRG